MPGRTIAIAPVRLARARLREGLPSVLLLVGAGAVAGAGWLASGVAGLAILAAAVVLAVIAIVLLAVVVSVRLEVEVATLRLRWLGGERRYTLARGPVTRVVTRGEGAAQVTARIGAFGWAVGPATLRDSEQIEIVRLAPVGSLILVPTDRGRLAIAAASESELISALGAAARVQQRLDEATGLMQAYPEPVSQPASRPVHPPDATTPAQYLTGIERTMLEARLATERAAALALAEAERSAEAPPTDDASASSQAVEVPASGAEEVAGSAVSARRVGAYLPAALPALVAAAVWLAAMAGGRIPGTEGATRPLVLAVGLGAAGVIGVLAARAWYPRLSGLVSITAVIALLLVGRSLLA